MESLSRSIPVSTNQHESQSRRDSIPTLVSSRVLILPALQELEELLCPPLLKETHKWALHRLHLRTGHLADLAIAVDKAACDLLELELTRHIGMDKDAGELARSDYEFGNEIDSVVAVAAELSGRGLIRAELAVELDSIHACW